ncbi:hypothetical protein DPMN_163712 [Dreissena polymorpha]|uniref:Uncharacterized protein n=1 Tax=Dreissena polymorpha TaxID=45954 RepID=A0A9D4ERP2_DREPO|nr:hypothetical protein DPMN_163712 [Dreissena polymorpha]
MQSLTESPQVKRKRVLPQKTWRRYMDADAEQMGKTRGSWRDSPRIDKSAGSWSAAYNREAKMIGIQAFAFYFNNVMSAK